MISALHSHGKNAKEEGMKIGKIFEQFREQLQKDTPLHPVDHQAAKYWVKRRLKHIFPELKNNPSALERAYQELSLEPLHGSGEGGETLYEMRGTDLIK